SYGPRHRGNARGGRAIFPPLPARSSRQTTSVRQKEQPPPGPAVALSRPREGSPNPPPAPPRPRLRAAAQESHRAPYQSSQSPAAPCRERIFQKKRAGFRPLFPVSDPDGLEAEAHAEVSAGVFFRGADNTADQRSAAAESVRSAQAEGGVRVDIVPISRESGDFGCANGVVTAEQQEGLFVRSRGCRSF